MIFVEFPLPIFFTVFVPIFSILCLTT